MLVHLKGLIGAKYPILLIRPIRCTSKKELHRYFADTQQSADAHDIIHVSTRGRGRLDGCRGSPSPRRKQRMVAAHNIQQSNTRRGGRGGNGLVFVEQRVGASTMRRALPMSFPPTLTTKALPSIAGSATIHLHLRLIRST